MLMGIESRRFNSSLQAKKFTHVIHDGLNVLCEFLEYNNLELIFWEILPEAFNLLFVIASLKDGTRCMS